MTRCCSSGRKSPPVSWRRSANIAFATCASASPSKSVQAPPEVHVRYGLDVEHERVHAAFMSTATATTSPASSVRVT